MEGMPYDAALGMRRTTRLNFAHGKARRARCDDDVRRRQFIELAIELLLEIDPLGPILLNKVCALYRRRKVSRKRQVRL
jgi:hypothetical protein